MKIGIITFHRAINYGAVLQAYALQRAFKDRNAFCRIIDYRSGAIEDYYKPFRVTGKSRKARLVNTAYAALAFRSRYEKKRKVRAFVSSYLELSEPVTAQTVSKLNDSFDVFVTGSDQVFNPDITKEDAGAFFLDFVKEPNRRCSYAASFGKDVMPAKQEAFVRDALLPFCRISVRESASVPFVSTLTGKTAEAHVDPTLLLRGEDWGALTRRPKRVKTPYVFVYNMLTSAAIFEAAEKLRKETGLPVYFCNPKLPVLKRRFPAFTYMDSLSPQEFLWMIEHAEYAINSSFHGTAFSLLFHKNFLSVLPEGQPKNARVTSLLHGVGAEDRAVIGRADVSPLTDPSPVDWFAVDACLDAGRVDAYRYLDELTGEV